MILLEPNLFEYNYNLNLKLSHFVPNRISRCKFETFVHRTHACLITTLNKGGDTHGPTTLLADERGRIIMLLKGKVFKEGTKGTNSHSIGKKKIGACCVRDKKAPSNSLFLKF